MSLPEEGSLGDELLERNHAVLVREKELAELRANSERYLIICSEGQLVGDWYDANKNSEEPCPATRLPAGLVCVLSKAALDAAIDAIRKEKP